MNGVNIPYVKNFIYLGLPIGSSEYKKRFFEEKFSECERSFYSLYSYGCKPYSLNPKTIAYIYKTYCQSIFNYGLESLYMTEKELESYKTNYSYKKVYRNK